MGVQKLQLDVYELKSILSGLIRVGADSSRKASNAGMQTSYLQYVTKKMSKTENILKLAAMNREQFGLNWKNFFEKDDIPELGWLMTIKGIKKDGDSDSYFASFFKK